MWEEAFTQLAKHQAMIGRSHANRFDHCEVSQISSCRRFFNVYQGQVLYRLRRLLLRFHWPPPQERRYLTLCNLKPIKNNHNCYLLIRENDTLLVILKLVKWNSSIILRYISRENKVFNSKIGENKNLKTLILWRNFLQICPQIFSWIKKLNSKTKFKNKRNICKNI